MKHIENKGTCMWWVTDTVLHFFKSQYHPPVKDFWSTYHYCLWSAVGSLQNTVLSSINFYLIKCQSIVTESQKVTDNTLSNIQSFTESKVFSWLQNLNSLWTHFRLKTICIIEKYIYIICWKSATINHIYIWSLS